MADCDLAIVVGHPKWWGLLEQVRTFCVAPGPDVRVQMEQFKLVISGTGLERAPCGRLTKEAQVSLRAAGTLAAGHSKL
jgi:hypothetical protein